LCQVDDDDDDDGVIVVAIKVTLAGRVMVQLHGTAAGDKQAAAEECLMWMNIISFGPGRSNQTTVAVQRESSPAVSRALETASHR
jgi:hypothetical protein